MNRPTDDLSGPAVQKREVLLVVGLIASWLVVVYFLVQASKNKPTFNQPQKASLRVDEHELSPAILERYQEEPEEMDTAEKTPLMGSDEAQNVLRSMRDRSKERRDFFGTLIISEPAPPPMVNGGVSVLQDEVIHGAEEQNMSTEDTADVEGEILEPEPSEAAEPPPPTTDEPTKL